MVVGQRLQGPRRPLESDQYRALGAEQVTCLDDRELCQGARLEDATGGDGQVVEGTKRVGIELAQFRVARGLERRCQLGREEAHHLDIGGREPALGVGPDSERADRAVVHDQGDRGGRDHPPRGGALHRLAKRRIVVDYDGLGELEGDADGALAGMAGGLRT